MAHVSKSGSVPFLTGIVLSAIIAAPTLAAACMPEYVTLTEGGPQVLVGCCNANGTPKTGSNQQRECVNPFNMCQQGHCDGTDGSTCNANANGTWGNQNGTCVVDDAQFCKLGECQQQLCTANSDPDLIPFRCDDNNGCKADGCVGSTYKTPVCQHDNVTAGTSCVFPDTDACTKGECNAVGVCGPVPDPGAFCGSAVGNTCTPKICDAAGACNPNGAPFTCNGTLQTCKKWQCSYSGQTPSCSQIKVDPNNPDENSCDTDGHDCKLQKCNAKGKCATTALPVNTVCDENFTTPLTDCYAGRCDNRKNCENEPLGIFGYYDDVACGPQDSNVCTSQTCQGLTCGVVGCTSSTCVACGVAGNCTGTAPNCTCTTP